MNKTYILNGLYSRKSVYRNSMMVHSIDNREPIKNIELLIEKIENNKHKIENISFDRLNKKELDYILDGLYSQQQSYGGGYFPHEDKVKYKHFKNVRSIIEKVEGEQKKRRVR